ncbi:MAG: hypothetical protein D6705_00225 [Deltaproteobacteria bacterium]|nr:MAG: hypothetical protein D6705_00225 [Deltaproteobacteria bacterium]
MQEVAEAAGLDVLAEPLAVAPHVPSSAPAWTREAVLEAVTDADAMRAEPSADAAVLVEPVGTPTAFAVRASLWRRGWAVASPEPVVGHAMPVAALAVLAALLVPRRRRGRWIGLAAAGGQGLAAAAAGSLAIPGLAAGERVWASVASGPVARLAVDVATAEGAVTGVALGAVAVLAVLLAWLDHRRSLRAGKALGLRRAVGVSFAVVGCGLACEASLRLGLWDLVHSLPGAVAVASVVLAAGLGRPWRSAGLVSALALAGAVSCGRPDERAAAGLDEQPIDAPGRSAPSARPEVADAAVAPVARVSTAAAWLDLLAQRPTAVRWRHGRLVVDLADPAARSHLVLGGQEAFRLATTVAGEAAGVLTGRAGALELPIDGPLAPLRARATEAAPTLGMAIRWRGLVDGQRVTVALGGRPLAHLSVGTSWEVRTFTLPADALAAAEPRLAFHVRRRGPDGAPGLAISRVEVGPLEAIREGLTKGGRVRFEGGASEPVRMIVERGGAIAWYLVPPRRGRLLVEARGRGRLRVVGSTDEMHAAGALPKELLAEPLRPASATYDIDLAGFGGAPLRLELGVEGARPEDEAVVSRAEIVVQRTRPIDRRPRGIRDLVVVAIEGVRPDDLWPEDGPSPHPVFERIAAEGLVFEGAHAMAPWAVPNHAALLTSIPPPVHRTSRGTVVADAVVTLAEHLERAGYDSVLATTNVDVDEARGLAQGFDRYVHVPPQTDRSPSALALPAALDALEHGSATAPSFLYLVLNDPQPPFDPPRERIKHFEVPEGAPLPHLTHIWIERVRLGRKVPTEEELAYVRALYRAELATVGDAVERLVTRLEERGRFDRTIFVLVGIHGEEFYEHGGAGHGRTLFEETLHVPLVIRAPGLLRPGRVEAPVDLLDLAPTLLDLLDLEPPGSFRGVTLVPLADDPLAPPRTASAYRGDGSRTLVGSRFKLIVGPGLEQRFFDLERDPGEQRDALSAGGIGLRAMRAALAWEDARAERWHRSRWGFGVALTPAFALDEGM